jgi:hypothetical protein
VGIAFFSLVTLISAGGLLTLTLAIPVARRSPALADAWLCCGMLAGVGAVGALVTSLLTFLSASLEIGLFIGVALIFIFLFLMTAGLLCFLRRYVTTCFCTADNQ